MTKKLFKYILLIFVVGFSVNFAILPLLPPPPGAIGPYLNGIFPSTTPGEGSSWELVDPYPDLYIPSPLSIKEIPNTNDVFVLSKLGEVWRVSFENGTHEKVLDIKDRALGVGESGVTSIALHPKFGNEKYPDKQELYIFYPAKDNPQQWEREIFLRLSKFKWDADLERFDPDSEEILIQQYDRWTWHNGGGLFFDNEGFLHLAIGDEGAEEFQTISTQRLDGGLFSGVFRIDVDMDPTRSHPIRRQPQENAPPEVPRYEDWDTYTQGYYIPNDNPWLNPDSSHLEEYIALGVRSPYSLSYDREQDQIWLADVGAATREEINKVDWGDNLQWPYREGMAVGEHSKPDNLIGNEKAPFFDYGREFGNCVIGGGIYRGDVFPNLNGKYLFADFGTDKLFALNDTDAFSSDSFESIISGVNIPGVTLPANPAISGIFVIQNGDVYLTVIGEDHLAPSKILQLKQKDFVPDPPSRLSEIGAFKDLQTLEPIDGFIPYAPNAQLWSDRAIKKRWMAIPNDGSYDQGHEQIVFSGITDWQFPEGTVFLKHFDLPLSIDEDGPSKRLETRFYILGEGDIGYGLSYRWNENNTEAFLVGRGETEYFDIMDGNNLAFRQKWDYPGRNQCQTCHTSNANFVLGVKTHQLNGDFDYDGIEMNQIEYLQSQNLFSNPRQVDGNHLKSYSLEDESVALGTRVRSYLDANCASCHRPGGVQNVTMDLRFTTPLPLQNLINIRTGSEASHLDYDIVEPGDHQHSELWIRDAADSKLKMPPLARNLVDEEYIEKLAEWIDGLSEEDGEIESLLIYPNPSFGHLFIQMKRIWEPPFQIQLYNLQGQMLLNENFNSHSYFMEFDDLSNGTYFIKVNANEQQFVEKVILQR